MKPKLLLTLASIEIALIGLLGLFVPTTTSYGFEVNMPAYLNATARIPFSLFFGLAVVNWFARNAEASKARNAIFLGNMVGHLLWAILVAITVLTPGAQPAGWVAVVIYLLFAFAFFVVGRANMSTSAS
jgi:Na+/proline symporter